MKNLILLSAFLLLIIIGCSSGPDFIPDQKQVNFLTNGVWLGLLPCNDCDGIDYSLNFQNDFTFKQKFINKGKDEEFIVDEGTWVFDSDSVIELESSDYGKYFLISGKKLIMLDDYGDRFDLSLEPQYTLHKDGSSIKNLEESNEVKDVQPIKEIVEMNPSLYQDKFLSGVDFIARGNEPNWTLEMDLEKNIEFATIDGIKVSIPSVKGIKAQDSDVTLYRAISDAGELVITVIKDNCQDNMSGEEFTYKVHLEAKNSTDENYKTFDGCGKFLSDQRLYGNWEMEQMTGFNLNREKLDKGSPQFDFKMNESSFGGHAGCNDLAGDITVVGDKVTFGNLTGTLLSCKNMKLEKAVIQALNQKTVSYSIDNSKLTLVSGKTKMVFKKVN